jgi:aconitase A
MALHNLFNSLRSTTTQSGQKVTYYSLPALEEAGVAPISKLPVSIRIVLEAVLRNFDGKRVSEHDVKTLANWNAKQPAGFYRSAAAGRSRCHAHRGAEAQEEPEADRAARAR